MSRQYKEFKVGDLFEYKRGKVKAPKQVKDGNIPMVSETNLNNGVDRFIDFDAVHKGGCVTVSVNYARNVFYQEESFCASVNIIILRNDLLNKYNGLYISSVLSSNNKKYSYTDKISKTKLMETYISLPITAQGEPDWQYMEDFMKEIESETQHTIETLDKISTISRRGVSNYPEPYKYKEFKVGELFEIRPTKSYKLVNKDLLVEGGINPVIVNTKFNNGVGGYTDKECTEEGGIITFSDTTNWESIFYQSKPFVGYPHVQGMYPKDDIKEYINMYNMKYFVTTFKVSARSQGFDYQNKFSRKIANELKVKLPITSQGNPDWQYMEDFMRYIEQESEEVINKIQNMF